MNQRFQKMLAWAGVGPNGRTRSGTRVLGPWLMASPALSLIAILLYSGADHAPGSTVGSVLGVGLISAAAALIVGALVGFLFGLPRTLEQWDSKALLTTNTNLDQISDWLTKILVGLGLVQIGKVAGGIDSLADSLPGEPDRGVTDTGGDDLVIVAELKLEEVEQTICDAYSMRSTWTTSAP